MLRARPLARMWLGTGYIISGSACIEPPGRLTKFTVKHHASNINTDAVHHEEQVCSCNTHSKAGFVRCLLSISGDHGSFQDQGYAATTDTEHEQGAAARPVHNKSTEDITNDADGDPAALEDELILCVVA